MSQTPKEYRAQVRLIHFVGRRYAVVTAKTTEDFVYHPGQFTKVSFEDSEGSFDRYYSIATACQGNGQFELCIILDDERTRTLLAGWSTSSSFRCSSPGGRFPVPDYSRSVVCVAGGSGITPLRAIIEDRVHHHSSGQTVLLYGCQRDDEIPFYESLQALNPIDHRLSLLIYADEIPLGRALLGRPLDYFSKHLIADADYLLCGPPGFMEAARRILDEAGIPKEAIHQDRF